MDYDWRHVAIMKILIIKLSAIGDVVQTLPALEAIKKKFPDSSITWLVEENAAGILEGHPFIDTILISHRKTWLSMLKNPVTFPRGLVRIIRFLIDVRHAQYDIAIDFQGLLKSGILIGLARAVRKIGFDRTREFSYLFLNERLPAYDTEKHALQRYLDVARYLGAKEPSASCTLPIERERLLAGEKIKTLKPYGRRLIVINPGARWKTKLWPEKNFAELADRLVREKHALIVFTGSGDDRAMIGRVISMMTEHALNWAGDTTLKELAALAYHADLFITTDTGPMHLAAAAGANVLALFGPTAPWRTGPYGTGHIVLRAGIGCSPCFKRTCDDIRCMEELTVDRVMKNIFF
jgi:heptosyltransferase-1